MSYDVLLRTSYRSRGRANKHNSNPLVQCVPCGKHTWNSPFYLSEVRFLLNCNGMWDCSFLLTFSLICFEFLFPTIQVRGYRFGGNKVRRFSSSMR